MKTNNNQDIVVSDTYVNKKLLNEFEKLHKELMYKHDDYFVRQDFDTAHGLSISIDIIQEKINILKKELDNTDE